MPRKRTPVSPPVLEMLRQYIKLRSNLDCSHFSHMRQLQQDIKRTTHEYLSLQTLNRFFGIIKNGFNPSVDTLNILTKYLQYRSFDEFQQLNAGIGMEKKQPGEASRIIVSLFSHMNPEENNEPGLNQMIRNISKMLKEDNYLSADLYIAMASCPFCRKYFFEQFVNIDALNKEYGNGLKYYMLHADSRKDLFFAHNVYCYRYFLTNEPALFRQHFQIIREFTPAEIISFPHSFIERYYAALIFDQALRCRNNGCPQAADNDPPAEPSLPFGYDMSLPGAGYLPGEALILTGEFQKAWDLLNNHAITSPVLPSHLDEALITEFNILRLMGGYFSGKISTRKALSLFAELSTSKLRYLSQDYFTLFILFLKRELFSGIALLKETNRQIEHLIRKTGFSYFKEYEKKLRIAESISINGD